MSQSPTESSPTGRTQLDRYRQGWKALNRLLHEDRSFSGNEKNCAYLNTGRGTFADVSAVTGLDYADDARAVAACDWDFDGHVDLWITNRTGPRVRFLRNQRPSAAHFLAIKLRGDGRTTNRDAIGARIEIYSDGNPVPTHMKTLHAGDGFLSQSSNWLHFGLGDDPAIGRTVVHWTNGTRETISGVEPDGFYHVTQGSGTAVRWNPPGDERVLVASPSVAAPSSERARIVLPTRLPLPEVRVIQSPEDGASAVLSVAGPALINVWSSSCGPCLQELAELAKRAEEIRARGLDVVALSTDRIADGSDHTPPSGTIISDLAFSFPWYWTDERTLRQLDYFQRAMLDRWQPLPVPCSFLIDRQGCVAVIYKGAAEVDQVLSDLALLTASPSELRRAATPFAGRWINDVPLPDPIRVVSQMIDHAEISGGIQYLNRYAAARSSDETASNATHVSDIYYVAAVLLEEQGRDQEALAAYQKSRKLNPQDFRIRRDLGKLLGKLGRFQDAADELEAAVGINPDDVDVRRHLGMAQLSERRFNAAIEQFQTVLRLRPNDALAHFYLANAKGGIEQWSEAIAHYQQCLREERGMTLAANNLAWILASHPEAALRDGKTAVQLAERICRETDYRQASLLDTLAVAYAETGAFERAVETATRAIELLQKAGGPEAKIASIRARRRLFERREPFRLSHERPN